MAKIHKYGVSDLHKDFPSDEKVAEFIFNARHSRKCSCGGTYRQLKGRRQFQCSKCRFQIAPTAGTIFHKSDTPLTLWFHAIYLFSNAKSGYSAKQCERDLNITYKTAWRMLMLIKKSLKQDAKKLKGDVEMDETLIGGRKRAGRNNEFLSKAVKAKSAVIGAIERGGILRTSVVRNTKAKTLGIFLRKNINRAGTRLLTDESNRYDNVAKGYERHSVSHGINEFVRGDIHINSVEGFWSHIKRSITGTHKVISRKYLPFYLDGFVFHYNNRHNDRERFASLIGVLLPVLR